MGTELELLRVKICEELELGYNEKMDWMKQEMSNYQNLYTKTLRQLEILKINHKNSQHSFQSMLNEQKDGLNFKILHLKQQNEELKEENMKNNSHSLKQQLQQFKSSNIECKQQIKSLQKEVCELNQANSRLNIENEKIKCNAIEKLKECEGKLLISNAECNGLKQRYNDLRKEFDQNKADYLLKENELQKIESNAIFIKNMLQSKKEEIKNLNEKIKSMQDEIRSINSKNDDLKTSINVLTNKHLVETQQIKQENFSNFNNLIESKQETDKRLQEVKGQLMQFQHDSDREIHSLSKELEAASIQCQQFENDKRHLIEKNKKCESEIDDLLNDIKCLKKENGEINHELQALTNKHRDIMDTNYQLTAKENKYLTQIEYLENDISEINNKIEEKLNNVTKKYQDKISEIESSNKLLTVSIDENKENNQKTLNKTKKDKQKYKKLATMTKLKLNALSKELNNIKRNFQTELRAKAFEITNLNKQIQQIERQRDEIKFRLTMDSTANTFSGIHAKNHTNGADTDLITNNVDMLLKELQIEQNAANANYDNSSFMKTSSQQINQAQTERQSESILKIGQHLNAEHVNKRNYSMCVVFFCV